MKRVAWLLVSVALCGGCGSARSLHQSSLRQVVLQPSDLRTWTRFQADSGTDADTGFLGSDNRTGVWIARYRRGRAVVVSRVDLYRTDGDAKTVFRRVQSDVSGNGVTSVRVPEVGDERVGYAAAATVPLHTIFWRRGNAIGSIAVQGRGIDAGSLASREDSRIRNALR